MPDPFLTFFIVSAGVALYVYVLYPTLLIILGIFFRRPAPELHSPQELPSVNVLIPAYNEESIIAEKIENTLALDYPKEKLSCTVVSDCSTDATDSIAERYTGLGVRFIRNDVQKGKIATISELGAKTETAILVITDANAIFEPAALRRLVAHFKDPKVGMANGNKVLKRTATMVGEGEGVYWSYETRLKRAESDVFSNAFVTGAMTAIRRHLFIPLPAYLEFDHVLPLHVVNQGCRVVFEHDARFYEETAPSSAAEWKVRVRNAVRGFTMVLQMRRYLSVLRHPWYTLHVYSRKILRWLIAIPAAGLLVANLGLLDKPFFQVVLAGQVAFYLCALLGGLLSSRGVNLALLALPFYFCLVNAASLVGLVKALLGHRQATWTTAR